MPRLRTEFDANASEPAKAIATRLKLFLDFRGERALDFATRARVPYRSLQNCLSARTIPGGEQLMRLAEAGVDAHWLLTGRMAPSSPMPLDEIDASQCPFLADTEFLSIMLWRAAERMDDIYKNKSDMTSSETLTIKQIVIEIYTRFLTSLKIASDKAAEIMELRRAGGDVKTIAKLVAPSMNPRGDNPLFPRLWRIKPKWD